MAQTAEGAVNLVLGVLADAAGIEENDVGALDRLGQLVAVAAQTSHHELAIEHIHLAADGFEVEFLHCGFWFSVHVLSWNYGILPNYDTIRIAEGSCCLGAHARVGRNRVAAQEI